MSAEQAYAICKPQAQLAANSAAGSQRSRSSGSGSFNCVRIGVMTSCNERPSGGRWSGLISAMDASRAAKSAARATMDACLAQYGWRD